VGAWILGARDNSLLVSIRITVHLSVTPVRC